MSIIDLAKAGRGDKVMRDLRVRSLFSPYFLTKVVLGYRDLVDHLHFHDSELFVNRWSQGARRQFIEWPRGFFKSTQFTIGTGIWVVCPVTDEDSEYAIHELGIPEQDWFQRVSLHNQDARQLYSFETDTNAGKKVGEVKYHFEENQLFRSLFPEIAYDGSTQPWNSQCIRIRRTGFARRSAEGSFEAIGVGTSLQSRHYDIVWEDDLVGERASGSQTEMEKTIGWHSRLSGAFVNAADQIRFGVSNRWGYSDLNSWIRNNEPEFVFYTRRAWEYSEELGRDIAIFPERYSIEALLEIKAHMNEYDFYCQYLNEPRSPGEKSVDVSKLHSYTVLHDGTMQCSCGVKYRPSQLLRMMHYDPFQSRNVRSTSKPCISVVGLAPDKHVFIIDYYMAQSDYKGIFREIIRLNNTWAPSLFTYEDVGSQNMTEFYLRELQNTSEFRQEKHRKFPRIEAVPTKSKPKEVRIREHLFPVIENGKVSARKTHTSFFNQLDTFPFAVPGHDYDLLDTLAQGAIVWRFPQGEDEQRESRAEEDEYLRQFGQPYNYSLQRQ